MSRKRKNSTKDLLEFYGFLQKLKERITIILDVNPSSGVDPIDEDVQLLHELQEFHNRTNMPWASKRNQDDQSVSQLTIENGQKDTPEVNKNANVSENP